MDGEDIVESRDVVPRFVRGVPIDLAGVGGFVLVAGLLLVGLDSELVVIRALVGFPLLLFVPGYLLLAVLFPERGPSRGVESRQEEGLIPAMNLVTENPTFTVGSRALTWTERVALSFGMSLALVPLIGLGLSILVGSFSLASILSGLAVYSVVGIIAGIWRRNSLPEDERFRVPFRSWATAVRYRFRHADGVLDRVVLLVLLVSVLAAVVTMSAVLLAPQDGETYSTVALVTEGDSGDLVASGYPTDFVQGEGRALTILVKNDEHVETTYTVVAEVQRVDTDGGAMTVLDEEEVLRVRQTVAAGDRWTASHTITPTLVGEDLRLKYYLYRGQASQDPSGENAYRDLHLWITVSESNG